MANHAAWLVSLALLLTVGCTTTQVRHSSLPAGEEDEMALGKPPEMEKLSARELCERGWEQLGRDDRSVACLYFSKALAKDRENPEALAGMGEIAYLSRDYKSSLDLYGKSLAEDSENIVSLIGLGRTCRALGLYDESMKHLEKAQQLSDSSATVLVELGITMDAKGLPEKAYPYFLEAKKAAPNSPEILNNLGFNKLLRHDLEGAQEDFEAALRLDPGNLRIKNNLAVVYALAGKWRESSSVFEETMGHSAADNNIGFLKMVGGDCRTARDSFLSAIDANPLHYPRAKRNLERLEVRNNCQN
jgi:Flp pilus assembly protein TadD